MDEFFCDIFCSDEERNGLVEKWDDAIQRSLNLA